MSTDTPTCAQRIAKELESREEHVSNLYDRISHGVADDAVDEAQEELDALPLEVSRTVTLKVLLSTGGSADYLTARIEKGRYGWERTTDVTYHFADWFDHAERVVAEGSPLETLFDRYVELQGDDS